jgi:hypothetical protein
MRQGGVWWSRMQFTRAYALPLSLGRLSFRILTNISLYTDQYVELNEEYRQMFISMLSVSCLFTFL